MRRPGGGRKEGGWERGEGREGGVDGCLVGWEVGVRWDTSSVGMRGKFILANSEPEQRSVPATTFSSGEAKVSHSSSTWTCLPRAPASFA